MTDPAERIQADEVVGVIGSRTYSDLGRVRQWINRLPPRVTLVTGTAEGPETVAAERANEVGIIVRVHATDKDTYGRSAGHEQKKAIVADLVTHKGRLVAFVAVDAKTGELSAGTMATVHLAEEAGVHVTFYRDKVAGDPDLDDIPVPPRIAAMVDEADAVRKRFGGERIAQARRQLMAAMVNQRVGLYGELQDLETKVDAGFTWMMDHPDHERFAETETKWYGFKKAYECVADCLARIDEALGGKAVAA